MQWYAETGARRVRQVAADLALLAWIVLWWRVSRVTRDLVAALGTPGRGLASSGDRIADAFDDVAGAVDGAPLVGGLLRAPFAELAGAADAVGDVGRSQEAAALALATWTGRLTLLVPVLLVGLVWAVVRVRGARRLGAARRLRDGGDQDLLALRALVGRTPRELLAVSPTPGADWRAGRTADLAALELRSLGLRPVAARPQRQDGS